MILTDVDSYIYSSIHAHWELVPISKFVRRDDETHHRKIALTNLIAYQVKF